MLDSSDSGSLGSREGKTNTDCIQRHIQENLAIFDFSLTDEQMDRIWRLDRGLRFFQMSLAEQEEKLGQFVLAD